jgi:putative DNA primase/helicase
MDKIRFTLSRRCPICNGYDAAERGKGIRCHGYLSDGEKWAHCSREQYAGLLDKHPESNTYAHKLFGDCNCGVRHDPSPARRIVATYDYYDEGGKLLYQVVRFELKDFRQRRPDGEGKWIWNLNGVHRVLYRLPQLLTADPQATIFIVEGEKDADRLAKLGLVATTNSGGSGKWRGEYNSFLRGRNVAVLPDNDEAGKIHAREVVTSLQSTAASVRVVQLPNLAEKGDVSNWLDAGGTVEQLLEFVGNADTSTLSTSNALDNKNNDEAQSNSDAQQPSAENQDIDVCMADVEPEEVEWLIEPYIPLGKLTMVEGDPDEGKSFAMLALTAAITSERDLPFAKVNEAGNVLLLSAEDGRADTIRPRLDLLGADVQRVFAVKAPLVLDEKGFEQLERLIVKRQAKVVLIDPLFAYVGGKTDINQDNKVRAITSRLADIAERNRCAIIGLRHLPKAQQRNAKTAGSSSIAWTAAARSVLLFGHEPDDEQTRGFVHTKHNLSKAGASQGYRIDEVDGKPHFQWTGECDLTAEKILVLQNYNGVKQPKLEEAVGFLGDVLEHGEQPQKEIEKRARKLGISWATVRRAQEKLKIHPYRPEGSNRAWWWKLPDAQAQELDAQNTGHTNEHVTEGRKVDTDEPLSNTNPDAQVNMWSSGKDNVRCSNEHVDEYVVSDDNDILTPLIPDAQIGSPDSLSM